MFIPIKKIIFIFNIIFLFTAAITFAQTSEFSLEPSIAQYQKLKNKGVLVIKLPTGSAKIDALNKQKNQLSQKRYDKLYQAESEKIAYIQSSFLEGFKAFYKYSAYIFVYDTNYVDVINRNTSRWDKIFLDKDLKPIVSNPLKDKTFLTFRKDQYFVDEYKAHEAFIVTDDDGSTMLPPFPDAIPIKFRRLSLMPDRYVNILGIKNLLLKEDAKPFYERYSYRKLDKNPYFAIVKMLDLKLNVYQEYLDYLKSINR